MTPQFPHYRVARRQQEQPEEYTWLDLLTMPSVIFFIGLVLGLFLSKCFAHHK